MNLNGLLQNIKSYIEESTLFNRVAEFYESLSQRNQKLFIFCSVLSIFTLIFSFPVSYFMEAESKISEYEQHRDLSKKLLKLVESKQSSVSLPSLSPSQVSLRLQLPLQRADLLEEQIGPVGTPRRPSKSLVSALKQEDYTFTLTSLNINQVLQVAQGLEYIAPQVKLTGLKIKPSSKNEDYYDASFTASHFVFPQIPSTKPALKKSKRRPPHRRSGIRGRK